MFLFTMIYTDFQWSYMELGGVLIFFHSQKTSKKIMYEKGSINVVEKQHKLKGIFIQTPWCYKNLYACLHS